MENINSFGKKPIQTYLNRVEWDMLEELQELTNAESLAAVMRAALISYYVVSTELKEKEAET